MNSNNIYIFKLIIHTSKSALNVCHWWQLLSVSEPLWTCPWCILLTKVYSGGSYIFLFWRYVSSECWEKARKVFVGSECPVNTRKMAINLHVYISINILTFLYGLIGLTSKQSSKISAAMHTHHWSANPTFQLAKVLPVTFPYYRIQLLSWRCLPSVP